MEKQNKTIGREEMIDTVYARNERKIKSSGLVEEIKPILGDYFVGEIQKVAQGLKYSLLNGQTFLISVKEI